MADQRVVEPTMAARPSSMSVTPTAGRSRNAAFVEVGGAALLYSLNYERLLADHWGLRIGASGGVIILTAYFVVPMTVSYL
jgi:hypothetical protein